MSKDKTKAASINFKTQIKEIERLTAKADESFKLNNERAIKLLKANILSAQVKLEESYYKYVICDEVDEEKEYDNFSKSKSLVEDIMIRIEIALSEFDDKTELGNSNSVKECKHDNIKLPKFDLPKFSGDLNEWLNFKDLYLTTIDKNKSLTDVEKLSYLQICCSGNALKLIRGFSVTGENYIPAWETLVNRFDNKRELAFSQINKLLNVKPIKSSKSIRELLDNSNEALRNLKTLGFEPNPFVELILVQTFQAKLDTPIRQQWEFSLDSKSIPEYKIFVEFLEKQARSTQENKEYIPKPENKFSFKKSSVSNVAVNNSNQRAGNEKSKCILCSQNHKLSMCSEFIKMPLDQRWNIVKNNKLCTNCLRSNHFVSRCLIDTKCKACNRSHHSLLHAFKPQTVLGHENENEQQNSITDNSIQSNTSLDSQCFASQAKEHTQVLLSTAVIKVKNHSGNYIKCRALLDSGSQTSMISNACCKKLDIPVVGTNHSIKGVNDIVAETTLFKTQLEFTPNSNNSQFVISALVVNKVTSNLPNFPISSPKWNHLKNLTLADPNFHVPGPIDILIGADLFAEIILGQSIVGPPGSPTALNTKLGWILSGKLSSETIKSHNTLSHHVIVNLDEELKRFWEIESIPPTIQINQENEKCEILYQNQTIRDKSGRYVVNLPFKREPSLGDSRGQAVRRFLYLENKLNQNPELKTQYVEFMSEYKKLGHMKIIENDECNSHETYYLPHHGVLREQSETTKLRVVFDGSAKTTSGESLNDILLTGPKIQDDLFNILLRFRTHRIAITADIEKMFRQIKVTPSHTNYQRILWREDPKQSIEEYNLLTVTYGTACAPYLAVRTIQQLAKDEKVRFPLASEIALRDFYVDDLLTGAETAENASFLATEIQNLMLSGGFSLRKWSSNSCEVFDKTPVELKSIDKTRIQQNKIIKVLGLNWNTSKDTFQIQIPEFNDVSSKRQLLSAIAKFFDPLGFLSPVTILLKIMMQDLWRDKLDWDDTIPSAISRTWGKFNAEIVALKNIEIPRYLKTSSPAVKNIQLHGFCDSSSKAYAAVFYVRVTLESGEIVVRMLAAKSRVAPLKTVTVPRLELCSALLLSRLYKAIKISFDQFTEVFLWSDSEITLCWIKSESLKDQFVKNRVAIINNLTETSHWHHIPGIINPADCASRGIMPTKLEHHPLWWNGPPWLSSSEFDVHHIVNSSFSDNSNDSIIKSNQSKVFFQSNHEENSIMGRYSTFCKLQRIVALCLRFDHNCRVEKQKRKFGFVTSDELRNATLNLVKIAQNSVYQTEIDSLTRSGSLPTNSHCLSLSVFLDKEGLLRVGGRLKHANLKWETKHPLLLPKNHHLTKLLINHFHVKYLHSGPELILNLIRQNFWIPSGRSQVKKILRECHTCLRFKSRFTTPVMGNLPATRVNHSRVFQITGVDMAGPIITKPNLKRSKIQIKSYIALFICFATKAVHLEAVSDLSTPAFLAALRRFISRRGKPSEIHSDNGSNFIGSKRYLQEQYEIFKSKQIQDLVSEEEIKWCFIPPRAPHFGGLWESNIKSTKSLLVKTCKSRVLNFEELTTLLTQIEACLNSRPLTSMSSDPNDLSALTPGHFLVGSPLLAVPEGSLQPTANLLDSWKAIQSLREQFWTRWSKEYLASLQNRSKWKKSQPNIDIGDLVLVTDNTPPLTWPLARISRCLPGTDGITRVVELKTANGSYKRPVHKLCRLPINPLSAGAGGC